MNMESFTEKISNLEAQVSDLAARREKTVLDNEANKEKLFGQTKIENLDREIKARREELEAVKIEVARAQVRTLENEAAGLLADLEKIDRERREKISRLRELEALADAAIPRRWSQISSKQYLKVERRVPGTGVDFTIKGAPVPRGEKQREEELISILGIKEAEKQGWKIIPGQPEPVPEELDASNSQEVRVFEMPPIFENIPPEDIEAFPIPVPIYLPAPAGGRYVPSI